MYLQLGSFQFILVLPSLYPVNQGIVERSGPLEVPRSSGNGGDGSHNLRRV